MESCSTRRTWSRCERRRRRAVAEPRRDRIVDRRAGFAIFEPKTLVYEQARRLADERGLPPDWLNDGVKGLLPDRPDTGPQVTFSSTGISVVVASPDYLFAMKAASARQEADTKDLLTLAEILHIGTQSEAFAMIERFYEPSRLSAKSQFFIQGAFAGDA